MIFLSCSLLVNAQGEPKEIAASTRIGIIDTRVFGDKDIGIQEFVTALEIIDKTLEPKRNELNKIQSRINDRVRDLYSCSMDKARSELHKKELNELNDNLTGLNREYEEMLRELMTERIDPIKLKIKRSISQFATENAYKAIVEVNEICETSVKDLICFDHTLDVTNKFIDYYNNQPPDKTSQ